MSEGYLPVDEEDKDSNIGNEEVLASEGDDLRPLFSQHELETDQNHSALDVGSFGLDSQDDALHGHGGAELHGWASMWLAYQSIGAIYGDIGTSPLYVFSSTFFSPPTNQDLVGVLSLIIWALILIATVKYVGIVLCAHNNGEGGSFALLSLLSRYVDLGSPHLRAPGRSQLYHGEEPRLKRFNSRAKYTLSRSPVAIRAVKVLAVLGVCMVISDGILTPAQSILGAVQGIKIAAPDVATHTVVVIACVLIIFLFAFQPFGVSRLSNFFAPIVIVWLIFNVVSGTYNLIAFDSSVVRAFSPWLGIHYLFRKKYYAWKSLGGVLLSFTGVEALFADLGAFSVKAIRVSWLGFAFPCLLVTYLGQAAFISEHPEAVSNPLFNSLPPGMYWPTLILSMLTSIVASQAMLTGTFQLISQAIRMSYLPNIRAVHTSKRISSQTYIPLANWLMMIVSLLVTVTYKNTTKLGNAYGVCVVAVSFITTWLVALVSVIIWNVHFIIMIPILLLFVVVEGLFLSSALSKVPSGGWFTVVLATSLASTLLTWNYGEDSLWRARRSSSLPRTSVFANRDGVLVVRDGKAECAVKSIKGIGIFLLESDLRSQLAFDLFLRKFESMYELSVLLNISHVSKYEVDTEDRFSVSETGVRNVFLVRLYIGYGEVISHDAFEEQLLDELAQFSPSDEGVTPTRVSDDNSVNAYRMATHSRTQSREEEPDDSIPLTSNLGLSFSSSSTSKPFTYIIKKDRVNVRAGSSLGRRFLLGPYVYLKNRNRHRMARLRVPADMLIEVGSSTAV